MPCGTRNQIQCDQISVRSAALMRPGRPNARCRRSVGVVPRPIAAVGAHRVVDADPPLERDRVVVGHLVGRDVGPHLQDDHADVALARARDEDAERERRGRGRGRHDGRRELQAAAHAAAPRTPRRAPCTPPLGWRSTGAQRASIAPPAAARGSASRRLPRRGGLAHERGDQLRGRVGLRDATARPARSGAPGPRSPRAARRACSSPSRPAPPRAARRPGGGGTSSRGRSRPRRARPASRPPAGRRGRRRRRSPATRRWSSWPKSSGRCWISVPPRATFMSCIPRQMPSSGMSRSSARRASATSKSSRSRRVPAVAACGASP